MSGSPGWKPLHQGPPARTPLKVQVYRSFFPEQFTVRGSQCFKEWSPWCWMVWSGSRPACLPLPFICLPVLFICLACLPLPFICLPGWVLVVGFPAGLSPTSSSFHLSPTSFHLSPRLGACGPGWLVSHLPFILGACGRVPGWLVSHFLSFVSQAGCLWSNGRLGAGGFPAGLSPTSFICLPLPVISLPSWALVVPTSFHLSPTSFRLSPSSFHLSPKLGACGRVWLACIQLLYFFSFVFQFFSFVSHAGCLWSGSRLACLPLPFVCFSVLFICLPSWVLVVGFPAGLSPSFHLYPTSFHLSPSSFHLSPRLGACGRVPGWLVSHFLSFVSHFFSFVRAGRLWSSLRLACLPRSFICLPLLSICHLSPSSFFPKQFTVRGSQRFKEWSPWCWIPGWLVSHFLSFVSHFLSFVSQAGPCGRVPGWLVSHFLSFVSHFFSFVSQFFSFVSQAGCLWSVSRLACLPLPLLLFICLPVLFICLPGWVLVVGFPGWLVSHFLSFPKQFTVRGSQCFKEWSPWRWMVWSGSRPACLPLPPQAVYC